MSKLISLPMYDVHHPDTEALLSALRQLLNHEGLDGDSLLYSEPEDRLAHWQDPQLLLSQTCGYPLRALLPDVQVVGTFHYQAAGCEGFNYSSHLVVREADAGKTLADFRGQRVVCNSDDSQSGYHTLRSQVAPLQKEGKFFSDIAFSGSHRQSLAEVQAGRSDIAAIDAVTLALVSRHEPDRVEGLVSIGTTALVPGLPMITSAHASVEELAKLRNALKRLVSEPEWREVREPLLIKDFSFTHRDDYQPISDAALKAAASGLITL
ncbi:phosphate/phosphite/phosphonate ABC transporters, periplasmic binding protein [Cedecea lapagei]|uniref:Phosphate/phosphite/phosphonate ABC transporters, periplasmic binding protein n=1 Tax=Cedecea lapagei TaxID=158823 RepID=A0A3S5DPJ4_9ENTR|nr:PhnD/SsuA/transferrin family substrate-binding protein [Cedecea lapagei]VEB95874.1 phosphate/phosphite/phosphonate ABC transporters, periplasmic binding protein [Cedecea lapagei]